MLHALRPGRLLTYLLFPLVLLAAALPTAARAADRPNILWLVAEDFGPHLGCYGTTQVSTPHLDSLARDGVRYARFYTTAPVCSASRSAFMTGMYQTTIGAHNHRSRRDGSNPLPEGVRLLPQWLADAGYFTCLVQEFPEAVGVSGSNKTDWNFSYEGEAYASKEWADLASHQPFFAQVGFKETHRKFNAPRHADPALVEIPPYYPDHPVTRQDWAEYLDSATELDRKIGRILAQLEADGLADDTIVVFFGDNGQAHVRGKQFCYEEGLQVPLLIRWPKNFPAPAHFTPGSVDHRLLMAIDLAPTMLAIGGAAVPGDMQGAPFLGEQAAPPRQYTFGARDRCDMTIMRIRTVSDGRYRYIRNFTPHTPLLARNEYKDSSYPVWNLLKQLHAAGQLSPAQAKLCTDTMPEEELYDLEQDPFEIHDLAQSAAHREIRDRLRGVLADWIETTDDQGRFMETLEQVQAEERRFQPELDWRPEPDARYRSPAAEPSGSGR